MDYLSGRRARYLAQKILGEVPSRVPKATATSVGLVKPGSGLTVDENGALIVTGGGSGGGSGAPDGSPYLMLHSVGGVNRIAVIVPGDGSEEETEENTNG